MLRCSVALVILQGATKITQKSFIILGRVYLLKTNKQYFSVFKKSQTEHSLESFQAKVKRGGVCQRLKYVCECVCVVVVCACVCVSVCLCV